jgi:hypothetical protein
MPSDVGDVAAPMHAAQDGPAILIGTVDGAGDRLAQLLGGQPRLCRVPRSRLLTDLAVAVERNLPALAVTGMPPEYWWSALGAFFDGLQRQYAARMGKVRWVTYVSSATLNIEELSRLFPTAQFVHVITPPRGGAGRIVAANRRAGAGLPPGAYLEVPESEMLTDAESCMRRILRFLGEADVRVSGPDDHEVVLDPEVVVDIEDPTLQR